ncbi:O-antigen ligase family protein [Candidatus Pelagibacter sp.]|nr:O-antigen ligase family protein [Candidatus Pelagibacter sp.]
MSENYLNTKINSFIAIFLGSAFFFLNLGISIFYILSFFFITYLWIKNLLRIDYVQKIFLFFLIYLILSNFLINYEIIDLKFFYKNLMYLKFLLLFLTLDIIFKNINLVKKILFINFFFLIFLIFEVYLQRSIGYEILGYSIHSYNRVTGPYGEELVIGTLILYVGFHSFFYFLINKKFKSKINEFFYFVIFFNLYFFSIYLTGERMNFLISLLLITLMIIILYKHRLKLFLSTFIFFILIFLTFHFNLTVSDKYKTFADLIRLKDKITQTDSSKNIIYKKEDNLEIKNEDKDNEKTYFHVLDAHLLHFSVAKEIWKDNKLFGAGVRSFQRICGNYDYLETFNKSKSCSTHPHNFILELLAETGLLGIGIFIFLIIYILIKNFKKLLKIIKVPENNIIIISFLIIFIALIWPLKTSGRLFSNFYGTIFWFNFFTFYILLKRFKLK